MIEIKNLSVQVGEFSLKNISTSIADKEYFVILGPTGAGKTVLIECIAGIHRIKQGNIIVDGRDITNLAPEERGMGYVPQDYVLFPFLNVAQNVAFGLKRDNSKREEIEGHLKSLANMLGLSQLLERDVRSLSGGEKQRVALARALARSPGILLLDEPLASLDQKTSRYLRLELRRIHNDLGLTTVHITHNQREAEEIADRIAILNAGVLEQVGTTQEVFFFPENETVSDFVGALNILECNSCRDIGPGMMEVDCQGMHIILPHDEGDVSKIAIRPRDVYVSEKPPPGRSINRFQGKVTRVKHMGATVLLEVQVGKTFLKADLPVDLFDDMNLTVGSEVYLILKLRRVRALQSVTKSS